jgi:hypothetical protein
VELGFVDHCDARLLTSPFFPCKVGGRPVWLAPDGALSSNPAPMSSSRRPRVGLARLSGAPAGPLPLLRGRPCLLTPGTRTPGAPRRRTPAPAQAAGGGGCNQVYTGIAELPDRGQAHRSLFVFACKRPECQLAGVVGGYAARCGASRTGLSTLSRRSPSPNSSTIASPVPPRPPPLLHQGRFAVWRALLPVQNEVGKACRRAITAVAT